MAEVYSICMGEGSYYRRRGRRVGEETQKGHTERILALWPMTRKIQMPPTTTRTRTRKKRRMSGGAGGRVAKRRFGLQNKDPVQAVVDCSPETDWKTQTMTDPLSASPPTPGK